MATRLERITPDRPTHASLFMARYHSLLQHALRLTGDREKAEDLLHDAFVQFTVSHPDLDSIRDLAAYLYVTLRHLHLSNLRQELRDPIGGLSILEYDSAELALRVIDWREQIAVQDELRTICRYACVRKETAKAGSVLILRFFHGYYLDEICALLRASYSAIKERLRLARSEAKLYGENPNRLTFMHGASLDPPHNEKGRAPSDLLTELRSEIFVSRKGSCLSAKRFEDIYLQNGARGPECFELAHLVSCRRCLDEANAMLGLPLLAERYVMDTLGKDRRKGRGQGGEPPTAGPPGDAIGKYLRRAKDVLQHEPKKLFISVNGYVVGSQEISSELMVQTAHVQNPEPIGFVEIFSEQKIRMLYLKVEPLPDGQAIQSARVDLSGGRTLEISLNLIDTWPTVQVVYQDPRMNAESLPSDAEEETAAANHEGRGWALPAASWRAVDFWRAIVRHRVPVAIGALLVVVSLFVYLKMPGRSNVSARELLRRSIANEASVIARPDQVLHRTFDIEEVRPGVGTLISRRRVEEWQSSEKGRKARRVYDENDRMVNGEWIKPDGTLTMYSRGVKLIEIPPVTKANKLADVWRIDPSAADFALLMDGDEEVGAAKVEERPNGYAITYSVNPGLASPSAGASRTEPILVHAVLVLSRADLHATEQDLVVQQEGVLREYRFSETSFERRPSKAVAPAVFEPEPELIGKADITNKPIEVAAKTSSYGPESPAPIRAVASAQLEIQVLDLLSKTGADLNEVDVRRIAGGALKLQAAVETEGRKREILSALAAVANHPAVRLQIETVAEAHERNLKALASDAGGASRSITVQTETIVAKASIPAYAEVRKYLLARGVSSERVDEQVGRLADGILARSHRIVLHAWALKSLSTRFSAEEVRTLDQESRRRWLAMIRAHAQYYRQEGGKLRKELDPILGELSGGDESRAAEGIERSGGDDAEIVEAIARMVNFANVAHEGIKSLFTIAPDRGMGSVSLKAVTLLHSLSRAEQISAGIEKVLAMSKHLD
jgi:RNA polymerase sigma factor (sigma-70 family)